MYLSIHLVMQMNHMKQFRNGTFYEIILKIKILLLKSKIGVEKDINCNFSCKVSLWDENQILFEHCNQTIPLKSSFKQMKTGDCRFWMLYQKSFAKHYIWFNAYNFDYSWHIESKLPKVI